MAEPVYERSADEKHESLCIGGFSLLRDNIGQEALDPFLQNNRWSIPSANLMTRSVEPQDWILLEVDEKKGFA